MQMKMVIDIPDRFAKLIGFTTPELEVLAIAVLHGTPLPKGHGRLIDGDRLEEYFRNVRSKLKASDYTSAVELHTRDTMLLNTEQFIHLMNTVIEADKDGEE